MTLPAPEHTDGDLTAGEVIGEYVVDGKLGKGAFGTVYRASHPVIGKQAAIKVLARKYSADPEVTSRFIAEARAVNQIRHKNIIDIFAFGQLADGRHYYVMEYLDGEPLDAVIDRTGAIPLVDALP
ncbi:MAG TPA: protein kinase, partial [Kofleriaceae bacterium]|nr:protein kinase [Kofleriaceae bacterium]